MADFIVSCYDSVLVNMNSKTTLFHLANIMPADDLAN